MEFIGWMGAALIVGMYFANSWGHVRADQPLYHAGNVVGAAGVALASLSRQNWSAAGLNCVWLLIGILWLSRYFYRQWTRRI